MRQTERYVFFFGKQDIFSNWHPCQFEYKGVRFNCVEQFMMYSKAMLFGDREVAERILASDDPKEQKALGRQVRGFDDAVWTEKCMSIVTVGCREKFAQSPALLDGLLATGSRQLVEASPYDKIWGIGMAAHDPRAENPDQWLGQNLLGKALMQARAVLLARRQTPIQSESPAPAIGSTFVGRSMVIHRVGRQKLQDDEPAPGMRPQ